jgi:hypothetical protein
MKLLFDACTSMQPRRTAFWDLSAWHMAWNGAAYIENTVKDPVERRRKVLEFFSIGEDYLRRGIESNPDDWLLFDRLGMLYRDKLRDPERAAAAYDEASRRPGHLEYTRRFAAYMLALAPGRQREAYARLLGLFREGEKEWLPTLLHHLQDLEASLAIPDEQRIYHDVVKLASVPGKEESAYHALSSLIRAGSRQPAVIEAARSLEQKMDIPEQRRVKLPVRD